LDVDKAVQWIGGVGEHAAELKRFELLAQGFDVVFNSLQGGIVVVIRRQLEELVGIMQALLESAQCQNDVFQCLFFPAQILSVFGIIPDVGAFQLGIDDVQALGLGIVVKDTSVGFLRVRRSLRGGRQVDSGVRLPWRSCRAGRPPARRDESGPG